jgi:hypothetical protein
MRYFELSLIIFGLAMVYEFFSPRNKDNPIIDNDEEKIHEGKKRSSSIIILSLIGILIFTLSFHIFLGCDAFTIFPKSYFTFSNSIITQSDVNQLIDKYNNATLFERVSMQNEPFFKKLVEKELIKVNTIFNQ